MNELVRKKDILNMMISGHSFLSKSYRSRATLVDIVLLVSAAFLNALIFFDNKTLVDLGININIGDLGLKLFSIVIFILSLIPLLVKWKERSEAHQLAADNLSRLLNECRLLLENNENGRSVICEFINKYNKVNETVIKIPPNKFNKLKSLHLKKVELSKAISKNPNTPYLILRIKQLINGINNTGD